MRSLGDSVRLKTSPRKNRFNDDARKLFWIRVVHAVQI